MQKVGIILLLILLPLMANERALMLKKMKAEKRIALVIGNSAYTYLSRLKNPINDARVMKEILTSRGFELLYAENTTKKEMKHLVEEFTDKLSNGGVGLYYFAGHGINVDGNNYLVSIDSEVKSKEDVEYEAYALNRVIKKLQNTHNRLNIIILDACRNDPFSRGGAGGLAPIGDAKGTFVAYATQAGNVALDGDGTHGIFTKNLIQNIQIPGATIEEVFKKTRDAVQKETAGKQSPGVYNQITGDFYFTFGDAKNVVIQPTITTESTPASIPKGELEFWDYITKQNTIAYYKVYLRKYPKGTFVEVAQAKMKELEQAKLQERDRSHIGFAIGLLGVEGWFRKGHYDYGTAIKATPDIKMFEFAPFVNYHPSLDKDGIYYSGSFGYHSVEVEETGSTKYLIVPGVGLGVGFRSVFHDVFYIDYGVKVMVNKEDTFTTFNAFTGIEF